MKKRKPASSASESQEEYPRKKQTQDMGAPRNEEDRFIQVSENIERIVSKRCSQDFSWTESRIFSALLDIDELLLDSQA